MCLQQLCSTLKSQKSKVTSLTHSVTMSPIELSWTAKNAREIFLFTPQAGERWRSTKWSSVDRAVLQKGLDFCLSFCDWFLLSRRRKVLLFFSHNESYHKKWTVRVTLTRLPSIQCTKKAGDLRRWQVIISWLFFSTEMEIWSEGITFFWRVRWYCHTIGVVV